ncbi:MAG: DUF5667 domain-containing protein [Candidatus Amesbacteria bacterium]|nr:DUF5667 domain-containing protein [Candidatus Amesbacteria bacterium]
MKLSLYSVHISRILAIAMGIAILVVSILSATTNPQAASQPSFFGPSVPVTVTETKVEYYLPYPGILPDSPVYKIKAVRDQIKLWTTFDPIKKAKLQLLYADKRINAAKALMEGGKSALAISTATKAEKYLESAVKSSLSNKEMLTVLAKSVAKHHEILKTFQPPLEMALKTNELMAQQVAQALLEN